MRSQPDIELIADNLVLPEGPRWRNGRLYFADMYGRQVISLDPDGNREVIAEVPNQPSGVGWLDDGRLIVVSMLDRKVLVRESDGAMAEFIDLSPFAVDRCNDMVVHPGGWAYVEIFPLSEVADAVEKIANSPMADLVLVDFRHVDSPVARICASNLRMPNGMVVVDSGKTLIVAETADWKLTAFQIGPDGELSDRRTWAELSVRPDGIAADAEGCIWVSTPLVPRGFQRVREGGEVLESIETGDMGGFACAFGGDDLRTLFLLEAPHPVQPTLRAGRIRKMQVKCPGAQ